MIQNSMANKIQCFGKLAELIGDEIWIENIYDTDGLFQFIIEKYPTVHSRDVLLSVNRKLVISNTALLPNSEIALLPPFSGG
jgi:molybdopterin converting factor small subunit